MKETLKQTKVKGQLKYKLITSYGETIELIAEDMDQLKEIRERLWLEVYNHIPKEKPPLDL